MKYLLVLFLAATTFGCGGGSPISESTIPGAKSDPSIPKFTTPKGVKLKSKPLTSEIVNVIDNSLTELFEDARALGYSLNLKHSNYTIQVNQECVDRSTFGGTWAFLLDAPNYDGTEWDQDPTPGVGKVWAAEQVLFKNQVPTGEYIICLGDLSLMADTTRFGAEHLILYYNSREKYNETRTHSSRSGHPILDRRKL